MTEEQQETHEGEIARVRGYLVSQSAKRSPEQIVEALKEAHRQFIEATASVPEAAFQTPPREGEWSAAQVLEHVCAVAAAEELRIRAVVEHGESPAGPSEESESRPAGATPAELLAILSASRERLIAVALAACPEAHLDITWSHRDFGELNWRGWLLFARVHTLDHARQLQAIAAAV